MEVLFLITLVIIIALLFALYFEIEHLIDNSFEIGKYVYHIDRRQMKKSRGKK